MSSDAVARLQAAWDACPDLPPTEFTPEEAKALAEALEPAPVIAEAGERERLEAAIREGLSRGLHNTVLPTRAGVSLRDSMTADVLDAVCAALASLGRVCETPIVRDAPSPATWESEVGKDRADDDARARP